MSVWCKSETATHEGYIFHTSDHQVADDMTLDEYMHYIRHERTLYTPGEHTTYTAQWTTPHTVVETRKYDGPITTRHFYDPDQPELF